MAGQGGQTGPSRSGCSTGCAMRTVAVALPAPLAFPRQPLLPMRPRAPKACGTFAVTGSDLLTHANVRHTAFASSPPGPSDGEATPTCSTPRPTSGARAAEGPDCSPCETGRALPRLHNKDESGAKGASIARGPSRARSPERNACAAGARCWAQLCLQVTTPPAKVQGLGGGGGWVAFVGGR